MAYRHAHQNATKIAENVWIGNYLDGQNMMRFEKIGATAILDLADNVPHRPVDCEMYTRCPFPDSEKADPYKIASAVWHLRAMIGAGQPTLIHCKGGHSRSVIIYALHEAVYCNRDVDEVVEHVRKLRTIGAENPKVGLRVQANKALKLILDRRL